MKMMITVENVTTTKAIAVLSALESAELLHETDVDVSVLPYGRSDISSLHSSADVPLDWTPEEPTDETDESNETNETIFEPAPEAWYDFNANPGATRRPIHRPVTVYALPVLGLAYSARLVPLTTAAALMGWTSSRLDYLSNIGLLETTRRGVFHYLTPEQMHVLQYADDMRLAAGKKKLSGVFLRRSTLTWLKAHPALVTARVAQWQEQVQEQRAA